MTVHRTGTHGLKLQQGRSNLGIREGFFPMVKITLDRFAEGACGISHVEDFYKLNRQTLPKMAKISYQV